MGWENTVTEQEMDSTSLQFVQGLHKDLKEVEPDLAVDGLSESLLSWILGILRIGRS
jgi:hypothetical protein